MNERIRLSDDQIRRALTPDDDGSLGTAARSISVAIAATPQPARRPSIFGRFVPAIGPLSAPVRIALLVLLLLALFLALYLPGALRVHHSLDSPMFHGDAARTGVTDQVGPVAGVTPGWDASLPGPLQNSPPVLSDGVLYCADSRGNVSAVNASDGKLVWQVSVGTFATTPATTDGRVFVGGSAGLSALDTHDGHMLWQLAASKAVKAPVAVVGPVVYAAYDATLFSLSASDGSVLWQDTLPAEPTRGPAVGDGAVYVGTNDGALTADATNGSRLWSVDLGDGGISTPAFADGVVYAATGADDPTVTHRLVALNAADGHEMWSFADPKGEVAIGAVDGGVVYAVGLDGYVRAIRNGALVWSTTQGAPIGSVATLSHGTLFVAASDGTLEALDAATGTQLWSAHIAGGPSPPILGPHQLFVGTDLGELAQFVEVKAPSSTP